jgi:hypothetical protein
MPNILRKKLKAARYARLLIVWFVAFSVRARAQEIVTGWEGAPSNGYAFVSSILSVTGSHTNRFVIRPTVSDLYYNFRDVGGFTSVISPGAALQIGYRLQSPRLTFTIGPGVAVRWDHRKLASGPTLNSTQLGATVEGDAFFQATDLTNLNIIASYEGANHYFWTRAGLKHQITNTSFERPVGLSVGGELTGQGNHDSHQLEAGALFEFGLFRTHSSLQVRAGYDRRWFAEGSADSKPYYGVGFYHRF